MRNQLLAGPGGAGARGVVGRLCAVQAQDFGPATWSVGSRTRASSRAAVLRAIDRGDILRTHVLRPTWHFVRREDLAWLLAATRARVHATTAARRRQLGLDPALLERCMAILVDALSGGRHLTRASLRRRFLGEGISLEDNRLSHILMHAELEGVVCSGRPDGVHQTHALFDERVKTKSAARAEEAAPELLRRYLRGHGPATLDDFRWWSSLTAASTAEALDRIRDDLVLERAGDLGLWSLRDGARGEVPQRAFLLHTYDELVVGYRESRALIATPGVDVWSRSLPGVLLVDGLHAGNWRRVRQGAGSSVEISLHRRLSRPAKTSVTDEAERLAGFFGEPMPVRFVAGPS